MLRRAAYDLQCSDSEITLTLLDTYTNGIRTFPRQYGADGCGNRTVYVSTQDGWVANTESR